MSFVNCLWAVLLPFGVLADDAGRCVVISSWPVNCECRASSFLMLPELRICVCHPFGIKHSADLGLGSAQLPNKHVATLPTAQQQLKHHMTTGRPAVQKQPMTQGSDRQGGHNATILARRRPTFLKKLSVFFRGLLNLC